MNKKVSVIIPVYNAENRLIECVSSVQAQTYTDLEILCINDGSKDKSLILLKSLARKDSRIIVIDKENGGVSSARNKGLEYAAGDFVLFVDSDDFLEPDMVERMMNVLEKDDAQVVICGMCFSNKAPDRIPKAGTWTKEDFVKKFHQIYKEGLFSALWNKLYIRDRINHKFRRDMDLGEDVLFNLDYFRGISRVSGVDFAPYHYYVGNGESLSWKYNKNAFLCEKIKNSAILDFLKDGGEYSQMTPFKEEFKNDFKRCFLNEIIKGNRSVQDLTHFINEQLMSDFWKEIYFGEETLSEEKKIIILKGIKKAIVKNLYLRYLNKLIQAVKKI